MAESAMAISSSELNRKRGTGTGSHAASVPESIRPEFVPLPPVGGIEPYSGLKRGKLNQLILPTAENRWRPLVHSISLRPRNCLRGKRLIYLPSLLKYLRDQLPPVEHAVEGDPSKILTPAIRGSE
jgi:hypothetical protein